MITITPNISIQVQFELATSNPILDIMCDITRSVFYMLYRHSMGNQPGRVTSYINVYADVPLKWLNFFSLQNIWLDRKFFTSIYQWVVLFKLWYSNKSYFYNPIQLNYIATIPASSPLEYFKMTNVLNLSQFRFEYQTTKNGRKMTEKLTVKSFIGLFTSINCNQNYSAVSFCHFNGWKVEIFQIENW